MRKIYFFLIFISNHLLAQNQQEIKYLEDKYAIYGSFHVGNAIGKYQKILKDANASATNLGGVFGYLRNPYGSRKASPVFYGAEIGFQSGGSEFPESQIVGDFRAKYHQFWLNGVVRYRPILGGTKLNPFIDAFVGGKFINTNIVEIYSEDESETLEKFNKIVPNYGFGIGTGFKLRKDFSNSYLDVGLYYQQADPTKIVQRNSVKIDQNFNISYKTVLTNTNQFIIRIGITGFFAR